MLVVIGAVATVIAAFVYLRVALAVATTADDGEHDEAPAAPGGEPGAVAVAQSTRRVDLGTGVVLFVAATMTLVLGLVPGVFIDWAAHAGFLL